MKRRELPTKQAFLDAVKGSKSNREVLYHLGWDPDSGGSHRLLRALYVAHPKASTRHFWPDPRRNAPRPRPISGPRVTIAGRRILMALWADRERRQVVARLDRRRFIDWLYHMPTRDMPLSALRRLIASGLVQPCCREHNGTEHVRLTDSGVDLCNRKPRDRGW